MGEWTKRHADEHKCDYPRFAVPHDTEVGDIWTCSCGGKWRVVRVRSLAGDSRSTDPRERGDVYTVEFEPLELDS